MSNFQLGLLLFFLLYLCSFRSVRPSWPSPGPNQSRFWKVLSSTLEAFVSIPHFIWAACSESWPYASNQMPGVSLGTRVCSKRFRHRLLKNPHIPVLLLLLVVVCLIIKTDAMQGFLFPCAAAAKIFLAQLFRSGH